MTESKMKYTGITPEQVLQIISALKGSEIRVLKYRGLHIEQFPEAQQSAPTAQSGWESFPKGIIDPAPPAAFSSLETTPVSKANELDEDDRLELIKLEDPEEYERLLEKRELENADSNDL